MTEHSIIFTAEEVRAYLDGRKTQARRVMKPQPDPEFLARVLVAVVRQWPAQDGVRWFMADGMSELVRCPYGGPGDRLWVRETFALMWPDHWEDGIVVTDDHPEGRAIMDRECTPIYRADTPGDKYPGGRPEECRDDPACPRWRSSTRMPRWACRLTPDVTAVRVERVQETTPEGICAEGIWNPTHSVDEDCSQVHEAWADVWDARRGCSWEANPWVWVIEFPRRKP